MYVQVIGLFDVVERKDCNKGDCVGIPTKVCSVKQQQDEEKKVS
jgi:hypothetical protein